MHYLYIDQHGEVYAAFVYENTQYIIVKSGIPSFNEAIVWCKDWLISQKPQVAFTSYTGSSYVPEDLYFDIMNDESVIEAYLKL